MTISAGRIEPEGIYIKTTEGELLLPADGSPVRMPRAIGPHEIALMLGVTRQRVTQLRQETDFPPPRAVLATGYIWHDTDIEKYAREKGRTFTPWEGK